MALTPEQERAADPNWDPVYGHEHQRQGQEELADSLTLGLAGTGARTARSKAVETLMNLEGPKYSDQGFAYGGDFNPESFAGPEAAQYSLASDAGEGKEAQLAALRRMLQDSDQSVGSQQALDRYQAEQDASQFAGAREGAIRQRARSQGRLGGAADMIASQDAAQAGADRSLNAGLQGAQMAALQRLAGTQAYGQLGGQVRGGDQALAFKNQDAINQFNMANTGARNATNMANVTNRNQAAMLNREGRQAVGNANVSRGDEIVDKTYGAAANRAQGIANALGGFAQGAQAQGAQQQAAGGKAIEYLSKFFGAGSSGGK